MTELSLAFPPRYFGLHKESPRHFKLEIYAYIIFAIHMSVIGALCVMFPFSEHSNLQ